MNEELLMKLGIDSSMGLKDVLENLEEKQFEILERLESVSDANRRTELEELNKSIDKEISNIKEKLKVLSSGLVIDNQEEEVVSEKEQKKAFIENKLNSLKEKEAQRKQEEEKKAKIVQKEKDIQDVKDTEADQTSQKKPNELDLALRDYRNQNYSAAFPVFKKYAENGEASIQYLLSQMYVDGNGTKQDSERAQFWLKAAANNGDFMAQFAYGMQLVAKGHEDEQKAIEGLKYLSMSAEQNYTSAMAQFVEAVNKGYGNLDDADKAIEYCHKLLEKVDDSFDSQKYDEYMKGLKKSRAVAKSKKMKTILSIIFTTFGSILLLIGGLYVFGGIHTDLWISNEFLKILPDANATLLLPIEKLWLTLEPYMTVNGMIGLEILILSNACLNVGDGNYKQKFVGVIEKVAKMGGIALIIWHFIESIIFGVMKNTVTIEVFSSSFVIYLMTVGSTVIIGMFIGAIVKKILRM